MHECNPFLLSDEKYESLYLVTSQRILSVQLHEHATHPPQHGGHYARGDGGEIGAAYTTHPISATLHIPGR